MTRFTNLMIEHIVLFQFQPHASPEAVAAVVAALRRFPGKIPGIIQLSCGENLCHTPGESLRDTPGESLRDRAQGFTHGLVIRFPNRETLYAYQDHPLHQEVVKTLIKPIALNILALDYEFSEAE